MVSCLERVHVILAPVHVLGFVVTRATVDIHTSNWSLSGQSWGLLSVKSTNTKPPPAVRTMFRGTRSPCNTAAEWSCFTNVKTCSLEDDVSEGHYEGLRHSTHCSESAKSSHLDSALPCNSMIMASSRLLLNVP